MRLLLWAIAALALVACGGDDNASIPAPDGGQKDSAPEAAPRDQYVPDTSLPKQAVVQVGGCPAFTACGGQLDGTWDYTGGCFPDPYLAAASACSSIVVLTKSAAAQGRLTFSGGMIKRDGIFTYTSTSTVPKACADTFGGCESAAAVIKTQAGFDTGMCTGTTDCSCTFSITRTDTSTDTYQVQNNQITTGQGDTYDYCVMAFKLDYSHVSGPSPEDGVFELTHE